MQFNQRVTTLTNQAPPDYKQELTVAEYAGLDDETKHYYGPLFAKYRTKKRREYCGECGHFVGWESYEAGVGDPIGYTYIGYIAAKVTESVLKSNALASRLLAKRHRL